MQRKLAFVLLLVAFTTLMVVEETAARDAHVNPCDNHCPGNNFYCLECCKAHKYTGGAAACHGPKCMCRI
ncbi:unnamed protein product [Allacma fusca]|uniref:Defensin n=1 Tax=Allacma fusca TaxID=39272 RepID=A0A8J2J6W3_9HEXA|nr:unnamed protein product [Allacma fusca]